MPAPGRVRPVTSEGGSIMITTGWTGLRSALRSSLRRLRDQAGMTTAEYAVGTVAAVAFAAVLYKVVRSPAVSDALSSIVQGALNINL